MTALTGEARLALKTRLAAHGLWLCAAQLRLLALKGNYNPNQPRVPAGDPAGGQWTSGGGSVDWKNPVKRTNRGTTSDDWKKFVQNHRADAEKLAAKLGHGSNAGEFLALSSEESNWGLAEAASNGNHFFGYHNGKAGPFTGQIGTYLTSGKYGDPGQLLPVWMPPLPDSDSRKTIPVFSTTTGYVDSGAYVVGKLAEQGKDYSNPATFFATLHALGWAKDTPTATYVHTMLGRYKLVSKY
jgi:hypothetical protein